ncbi:MAG: hypothetical protein ACXAC5_11710 [Promethearchaeota archaeon]|jgi:hypothetical protein
MVIIFYDSDKEVIYICTEREKMKSVPVDDPNLISYVPNDDILYVQNAHFITKRQFSQWLEGEGDIDTKPHRFSGFLDEDTPTYIPEVEKMVAANTKYSGSQWLHPAHNGAIHIPDVKTEQYPNGIQMVGKYDFVPIDAIGGFEALEESPHFKLLLARGKIEVVGYEFVKKNHGKKKQVSVADAALDAILIKNGHPGSAEAVAAAGGINASGANAIEFLVE